jgi:membrane protease YdiL (CAAX protease family)
METGPQSGQLGLLKLGRREILAGVWLAAATGLTFAVTAILKGSFPIFTFMMLVVMLAVLLRGRDAARIGMGRAGWGQLAKYTILSLAGSLALMAIFEPWSHTYGTLAAQAVSSERVDTTFGWLVRYPGPAGWAGFVVYAGSVTLFAEEVFFRGWLLTWLKRRVSEPWAVMWQATLFTLPQALAALLLPPMQGVLYAVVYSWLAIGLIGGWAASRTGTIWPSLAMVILYNVMMVAVTL